MWSDLRRLSLKLRHAADALEALVAERVDQVVTCDNVVEFTDAPVAVHWTKRPENADKVKAWKRRRRATNAAKSQKGT